MIDLTLDARDIKRIQTMMHGFGEEATRAFARTLNRVARGVRTDGVREARKAFNVKAKTLRQSFHFMWANPHKNIARVRSLGGPEPLSEFGMRTSSGRRKRGVTVLVSKEKGRFPLRHAFVGKRRHKGKPTIAERKGASRLPLKTLYGLFVIPI